MRELRARTISGLGWSGLAQVSRQGLQFGITVVLARLLVPEQFGMIGMILVFAGFARLLGEMGLGAALVQHRELRPAHLRSVFWVNLSAGIVLTAAVAGAAPWIERFYAVPGLRPLTVAVAFNFLIASVTVVQDALLRREMRFRELAGIELAAIVISGSLAIGMAMRGAGAWSLVAQILGFTAVTAAGLWIVSPWRPSWGIDRGALRSLFGFSSNLLGFNVVNYWTQNLDNLLIGRYIGSHALGIYGRAYNLMYLPAAQVSAVVSKVMFPALSTIQGDVARMKRIYLRTTRMISLVSFPMMIGLLVVAEPFILVVFGARWSEVVPVLRILCVLGIRQSVGTTSGLVFTSRGRTDILFRLGLVTGLLRGLAIVVGLRWGIIGVAIALVAVNYVLLWYPAWTLVGRMIDSRFRELVANLAPTFGCAALMGAAVWGLDRVLPSTLDRVGRLAILVAFGSGVYVALVVLFRPRAYRESLEVVREIRGTNGGASAASHHSSD